MILITECDCVIFHFLPPRFLCLYVTCTCNVSCVIIYIYIYIYIYNILKYKSYYLLYAYIIQHIAVTVTVSTKSTKSYTRRDNINMIE